MASKNFFMLSLRCNTVIPYVEDKFQSFGRNFLSLKLIENEISGDNFIKGSFFGNDISVHVSGLFSIRPVRFEAYAD